MSALLAGEKINLALGEGNGAKIEKASKILALLKKVPVMLKQQ